MRTLLTQLLLATLLAGVASPVSAHGLTVQECLEGGDFISNAAQARENGVTKETFLERLVGDIRLIQTFPPQLRWFVVDPEDAEFLHAESSTVFDQPQVPEAHRAQFLSRCFDRSQRLE